MNVIPSRKAEVMFITEDEKLKDLLASSERYFIDLASAEKVTIIDSKSEISEDTISVVLNKAEAFLPLSELIDFEKELERLNKEKEKLEGEIKRVNGKLSNESFTSKAPESVVNEEKDKKVKYEEMMKNVLESISQIEKNL